MAPLKWSSSQQWGQMLGFIPVRSLTSTGQSSVRESCRYKVCFFSGFCVLLTTLFLFSYAGCGLWLVLLTSILSNALFVRSAPSVEPGLAVIRPLKDIIAKAGETVLFECHILGPKDTDVDWLADGKLIQPALLNCKMHFDGRKCRLLLNSVHEDDSGTYTCKLSTAKG